MKGITAHAGGIPLQAFCGLSYVGHGGQLHRVVSFRLACSTFSTTFWEQFLCAEVAAFFSNKI